MPARRKRRLRPDEIPVIEPDRSGFKERWRGEKYDENGRRWRLKGGPIWVWSDRPIFISIVHTWRRTNGGLPLYRILALPARQFTSQVVCFGIVALLAAFLGALTPSFYIGATLLIVSGACGVFSLAGLFRYLPVRRYCIYLDRCARRVCPSCSYPLKGVRGAAYASRVACPECGHLWRLPPPEPRLEFFRGSADTFALLPPDVRDAEKLDRPPPG